MPLVSELPDLPTDAVFAFDPSLVVAAAEPTHPSKCGLFPVARIDDFGGRDGPAAVDVEGNAEDAEADDDEPATVDVEGNAEDAEADDDEPAAVDVEGNAEDAEVGQEVLFALSCAPPVDVGVCWTGAGACAAAGAAALACWVTRCAGDCTTDAWVAGVGAPGTWVKGACAVGTCAVGAGTAVACSVMIPSAQPAATMLASSSAHATAPARGPFLRSGGG
jgi:hypothetical protein